MSDDLRIMLERGNAAPQDVTEAVQIIYDALTASMDYGSGFLDWEEVAAIQSLAESAGFEQPDYPTDFCTECHHDLDYHRQASYSGGGDTRTTYLPKPCRYIHPVPSNTRPWPKLEDRLCGCENGGDIRPRWHRERGGEPVPQPATRQSEGA